MAPATYTEWFGSKLAPNILEEVLVSAKEKLQREERFADGNSTEESHDAALAPYWLKVLDDQREKSHQLLREFISEAEQRVEEPGTRGFECEAIAKHCEHLDRQLGAIELFLSPIRSGSPLALWRTEKAASLVK